MRFGVRHVGSRSGRHRCFRGFDRKIIAVSGKLLGLSESRLFAQFYRLVAHAVSERHLGVFWRPLTTREKACCKSEANYNLPTHPPMIRSTRTSATGAFAACPLLDWRSPCLATENGGKRTLLRLALRAVTCLDGTRGQMNTPSFFLASLCPAILLGLRAIALRRISRAMCLAIDLTILVISMPLGMQLVSWVENSREYPGDHSPGLGLAFYLLFLVWLCCFALWSVRAVVFVFRKYLMAGNH